MPIYVYNRHNEDHTDDANNYVIMRPSVLGNPFTEKPLKGVRAVYRVRNRAEAISRYSSWFDLKYDTDASFRAVVDDIYAKYRKGEDVYLECCCKPNECHGDVIVSKLKSRLLKETMEKTMKGGEACR